MQAVNFVADLDHQRLVLFFSVLLLLLADFDIVECLKDKAPMVMVLSVAPSACSLIL
jgi:hypothetical protein